MARGLRRQLRRGSRGFTLIELVVVMMIIVIAFFAVRPQFGNALNANRERAALRRVVGVLTVAHAKAVSEGRLVRVMLAPYKAAIWAEIQVDPRYDRAEFEVLALLGKRKVSWPEALAVNEMSIGGVESRGSDEAVIYFFPDGRTSGASFIFEGLTGQLFAVDLSPATGKVQVRA